MSDLILFEYPLHERSRTLLRLAHSFAQFDFHLHQENSWETRAAMNAMLDISAMLARADIKSELIKEMEKQSVSLGKMRQTQGVDADRLEEILLQLNSSITNLHGVDGQLGKQIRDNEFLKTIQQRCSLPGGDADFDLPLYYHWLERPHADKLAQLEAWMDTIKPLRQAVDLLLMLVRGSSVARDEMAENGFFQKTLDGSVTVQLLRIAMPRHLPLYPEVSGGKHRFNIRFMQTSPLEHPSQTHEHVPFRLTTCVI